MANLPGLSLGLLVGCFLLLGAASFAVAETPDLALGKRIFTETAEPRCAICHTLGDADAAGEIGPNLDQAKPSEERVRNAVTNGFEAMPTYRGKLTEEEIAAVAHYVATVTGGAGAAQPDAP